MTDLMMIDSPTDGPAALTALTAERATLLAYLGNQRQHVLGILEGLDATAYGQTLLPSGWTCAGMIGHLAIDVERFWFQAVIGGHPEVLEEVGDNAWRFGESLSAAEVCELYRAEITLADQVIAATPLDAPPAWWPEEFPSWRMQDLREVILHVITETACHAGHLDAARELVDGRQWLVLR